MLAMAHASAAVVFRLCRHRRQTSCRIRAELGKAFEALAKRGS